MGDLRGCTINLGQPVTSGVNIRRSQVGRCQGHMAKLDMINRWTPVVFHVCHVIVSGYGVLEVLPAVYERGVWLRLCQILACTGLVQLVGHWRLSRDTDSSYRLPVCLPHPHQDRPHLGYPLVVSDSYTEHSSDWSHSPVFESFGHEDIKYQSMVSNGQTDTDMPHSVYVKSSISGKLDRSFSGQSYDHEIRSSVHLKGVTSVPDTSDLRTTKTENSDSDHYDSQTWSRCDICRCHRPPRCYHCPVCRCCILQRDHHCFFLGICIGARNQRHFLAFIFWCVFDTLFASVHMYVYAYREILHHVTYFDFLPPVAFVRAICGYIHIHFFILSLLFWIVNGAMVGAIVYAGQSVKVLYGQVTSSEISAVIPVIDTRPVSDRLRQVLGENWLLNFVFPFKRPTVWHGNIRWLY